jgi:hypothetical protein
MLRNKIVKQALQQGFTSRSRWLLQILGLTIDSRYKVFGVVFDILHVDILQKERQSRNPAFSLRIVF